MSFLKASTALAVSFVVLAGPVHAQVGAAPVAEAAASAETTAAPMTAAPAVAAPAVAVPATPAPAFAIVTPGSGLMLPAYTDIVLTPDAEANSKTLREGDAVPMRTLFDVMHNGVVVIPKGTRGLGTVTWRTGKGAFGKSAKMEITFNELTLANGHRLALSGKHRQEGQGNTGAAVGAAIAVGVFGAFVTGKSAIIPNGQHLTARTADALSYAIPAGARTVPTAELAPAAPVATIAPAAADAAAPAAEPVVTATPTKG